MKTEKRGDVGLRSSLYPTFGMFGPNPRELTHEESINATAHERIGAIWRYLIRTTLRFHATLKPHERINLDPDDIMVELYAELTKKDQKWKPEVARYLTFASVLAKRHLIGLRDKAHTVHSPRNSSCRMVEYAHDTVGGRITDAKTKTLEDIKRSAGTYLPVDSFWDQESPDDDERDVEGRERRRLSADAVTWGLMALTPFESRVLALWTGMWEQERLTIEEIAVRTNKSRDAVKKSKDDAIRKVRERLIEMGHPAVASEN